MSVTVRALWFVETHLHDALSIDTIADVVGVSRFHLSHAFSSTLGTPVATYVRARRLTRAAKVLAGGTVDVLSVALDTGYGSHEAFTRAFSQHFGVTPELVRDRRTTDGLVLTEPIRLEGSSGLALDPPRIDRGSMLRLTGIAERHASIVALPTQWSRFIPLIGHIAGQIGGTAYGVTYNTDETGAFDYLCGVAVADFRGQPADCSRLTIPPATYAVFVHRDHIASVSMTIAAVFNHALTSAGLTAAEGPFFERYDERFNARTGMGGFEIWIPIAVGR